jgi:hypothetical protein
MDEMGLHSVTKIHAMTLNSKTTFREANISVRTKPLKRLRRQVSHQHPAKAGG